MLFNSLILHCKSFPIFQPPILLKLHSSGAFQNKDLVTAFWIIVIWHFAHKIYLVGQLLLVPLIKLTEKTFAGENVVEPEDMQFFAFAFKMR